MQSVADGKRQRHAYIIINFSTSGRFAPSAWASYRIGGSDALFAPVLI